MYTIDDQGRLKEDNRLVKRIVSPYNNGAFSEPPGVTVMHFTYGASATSSANWFKHPGNKYKASAHIVIARDGTVIQCVDFDTGANHAGRSRWLGRSGLNRWSFGIELANWGYLQSRGASWASYTGKLVPDPVLAVHKNGNPNGGGSPIGWEPYPEEQLEAAAGVVRALVDTYGQQQIIGHDDISPSRKWDPGPAFDMVGFRARVLDDLSVNDDNLIKSVTPGDTLSLREGPGMGHAIIMGLPDGSLLEPLETSGNWVMVHVLNDDGAPTKTGWVYSRLTTEA